MRCCNYAAVNYFHESPRAHVQTSYIYIYIYFSFLYIYEFYTYTCYTLNFKICNRYTPLVCILGVLCVYICNVWAILSRVEKRLKKNWPQMTRHSPYTWYLLHVYIRTNYVYFIYTVSIFTGLAYTRVTNYRSALTLSRLNFLIPYKYTRLLDEW